MFLYILFGCRDVFGYVRIEVLLDYGYGFVGVDIGDFAVHVFAC